MRTGKSMSVSPANRRQLQALIKDRNAAQKHVWRAEIVLFTADGVGTNEIMRRTGKSKTCVWRWQERFLEEGFEGLLRDKTRPSRIKPLGGEAAARVVALTLGDPPGETTLDRRLDGEGVGAQRQFRPTNLARRTTRSSSTNYATWLGSMSIRPRTPSSCPSTKKARFRRSTALSPACHSRRVAPEP